MKAPHPAAGEQAKEDYARALRKEMADVYDSRGLTSLMLRRVRGYLERERKDLLAAFDATEEKQ